MRFEYQKLNVIYKLFLKYELRGRERVRNSPRKTFDKNNISINVWIISCCLFLSLYVEEQIFLKLPFSSIH